jgi:hypothetical protein
VLLLAVEASCSKVARRRSETLAIGEDQRVDTAGGASAWIGELMVVKATIWARAMIWMKLFNILCGLLVL